MNAVDVIRFWFEEIDRDRWWSADAAFDDIVRNRFGAALQAARRGELFAWRRSAEGRLAEIIVLDQFARNIHRGTAEAYAGDPVALVLAQEAVARGADRELAPERRAFLYMPFMHSESLLIHDRALELFGQPGLAHNLEFETRHRRILERFGRYPHRNAALGRPSTAEELEFLRRSDSAF